MLALAIAACAGGSGTGARGDRGDAGSAGADGAAGPAGPTGPAGAPGGAYRWHDVTGAQVTVGSEASVWSDGVLWPLDLETGQPSSRPGPVYHQTDDCSDPGVLSWALPGFAVNAGGQWYVRPADLQAGEFCGLGAFSADGETCSAAGDLCLLGVSVADLLAVARPQLPYQGPLHPEPIQ